ncbi:hypothetical protein [Hymenobacter convexus]|uniref:hypothetical protein n=1 Tax=Hymenobacter sp. CA1UV-4 TaxID=3063782 RepID=UPI0027140096|nr:hypothetical protein [Hymenobacter sp. CA1UV-4]MDO7852959.1 hypothetical protein [Hymenobacter sp. CA1UV-4]
MNLYQTAAPDCQLIHQSIDYAGAGLQWSIVFDCYVTQVGDHWLCAYPSAEYSQAVSVFLTCDEDVLMGMKVKGNAGLRRAITKAQRLIDARMELAECEDMDNLTERLGMGRMFGTVAFA